MAVLAAQDRQRGCSGNAEGGRGPVKIFERQGRRFPKFLKLKFASQTFRSKFRKFRKSNFQVKLSKITEVKFSKVSKVKVTGKL